MNINRDEVHFLKHSSSTRWKVEHLRVDIAQNKPIFIQKPQFHRYQAILGYEEKNALVSEG